MGTGYTIETPNDKEIDITYEINAPRELVWKAYTDPNLIPQWYGPSRYTITVEKMDMRPGGKWKFVSQGADGRKDVFSGEVRDILFKDHIIETFKWSGAPRHGSVDEAIFEDADGKTRVRTKSVFKNAKDRDRMLQSGMEAGMAESIDRLQHLMDDLQGQNISTEP